MIGDKNIVASNGHSTQASCVAFKDYTDRCGNLFTLDTFKHGGVTLRHGLQPLGYGFEHSDVATSHLRLVLHFLIFTARIRSMTGR